MKKPAENIVPILKTERLVLRPYVFEDTRTIYEIATNYPDLTQYMCWNPPKKIEEIEENFRRSQQSSAEKYTWSITYENQYVGRIDLRSFKHGNGVADFSQCELGYWLSPAFHRRGMMSEVLQEVLRFAFSELKMRKVIGAAFLENVASQQLLEKNGARRVGILKEEILKNGIMYDEILYEFLASDF